MESQFRMRIRSIDQFRGYTIAGMIFVNFLGQFPASPEMLKHHVDWMSYADTIAPIFVLVAGMGFRLSMLRRAAYATHTTVYFDGLRRYLILFGIGIVYYGPLDPSDWWDALVDIALSGLLTLPVILASVRVRLAAAAGYMLVYQSIFTFTDYGAWVDAHSFNGGPLGPLSYVFCMLLGTVLYDLIATERPWRVVAGCLLGGAALVAIGWLLHIEWPGLKPEWRISQYDMSAPYPIIATGLAFWTYLPFYVLSDRYRIELPTLTVVGANPLVLYILHGALIAMHGTFVSRSSGFITALLAFAGLYAVCWTVAVYLYRNRMLVKI